MDTEEFISLWFYACDKAEEKFAKLFAKHSGIEFLIAWAMFVAQSDDNVPDIEHDAIEKVQGWDITRVALAFVDLQVRLGVHDKDGNRQLVLPRDDQIEH